MLQSFQFSGASTNIAATGSFWLYAESTTARLGINDRVMLMIDGSSAGIRRPGDWVRLPFDAKRWQIIPLDPACAGVCDIGVGQAGTARTVGQVELVDGGVQRSLSGTEYWGVISPTAGVGNVPYCGISHATRRFSIRKIVCSLNGVAGRIQARQFTGAAPSANDLICRSKDVGQSIAGMNCHRWEEASEASALVTVGFGYGARVVDQAAGGRLAEFFFDPPCVLPLGAGMMLTMNTQSAFFATFEGSLI